MKKATKQEMEVRTSKATELLAIVFTNVPEVSCKFVAKNPHATLLAR